MQPPSGLCKCRRKDPGQPRRICGLPRSSLGRRSKTSGTLKLGTCIASGRWGQRFPWPRLLPAPRRPRPANVPRTPAKIGIEGKGPGVGKAVQHLLWLDAAAEFLDSRLLYLRSRRRSWFSGRPPHIHHVSLGTFHFHGFPPPCCQMHIHLESLYGTHSLLRGTSASLRS